MKRKGEVRDSLPRFTAQAQSATLLIVAASSQIFADNLLFRSPDSFMHPLSRNIAFDAAHQSLQ
jgi:hypothetical protein